MSLGWVTGNRQQLAAAPPPGAASRAPPSPSVALALACGAVVPPEVKRAHARVPVPRDTLIGWNVAMMLFHAALAALTATLGNFALAAPLYRTDIVAETGSGGFALTPVYAPGVELPLTTVAFLFFATSSAFHGGNAFVWRGAYLDDIATCRCRSRWAEYFLSATMMIVLIAYTTAVREQTLMLAVGALIATTMGFGWLTEELARPASSDAWALPFAQRIAPHVFGYIPQCAAWAVILINFYDEPDEGPGPPEFVYYIVWSELVLFFSFGLVQLWQQANRPALYARGELAYQALSLVSKGVLGGVMLANVLVFSNIDDVFG